MPSLRFQPARQSPARQARQAVAAAPLALEETRKGATLTSKESEFVRDMEVDRARNKKMVDRDEERRLFGIYQRFSNRAKELVEALNAGKANGEEPEMRKELEAVERTRKRIFDIIVLVNYGLACKISWGVKRKYQVYHLSDEDLAQEGSMGVMKDVDRFDLRRGTKFSTYAVWQIRQFANRAIQDQERTVRLSVHASEVLRKIYAFIGDFTTKNARFPDIAEICRGTGCSEKKVKYMLELKPDTPMAELDHNTSDADSDMPFRSVVSREKKELLARCMAGFEPRERSILEMRFGLDGSEEQTLKEVGKTFHLTRERIRQIQARALAKLKIRLGGMGLREAD